MPRLEREARILLRCSEAMLFDGRKIGRCVEGNLQVAQSPMGSLLLHVPIVLISSLKNGDTKRMTDVEIDEAHSHTRY